MPPTTKPNLNLNPSSLFDAIIIGAGPAGLSAALALSRVRRTAVIFNTNAFRNARAHRAHTILSRDHTPPSEILGIGREEVERYGTSLFVEKAVVKARQVEGKGFEVDDEADRTWRGRKVVLATGVEDVLPEDIEGYADCWGESIYQCLFCDGLERSEGDVGMLGWSGMGSHMMRMLFLLEPKSVMVFLNGSVECGEEKEGLQIAKARGVVVHERPIERLVHLPNEEGIEIMFRSGETTRVRFLQHSPPNTVVAPNLAQDLGVEILDDGRAGTMLRRNEPWGETNVKGVFCVGDSGTFMRQVTTAMQQGASAGALIAVQIAHETEEEAAQRLRKERHVE